METTKRCSQCGRELPLTEYYKNKRNSDGLHAYCKSCTKDINRRAYWRKRTGNKKMEGTTSYYTDPELDDKTNREVMDIMVRCKRWLEARGCIIHLSGEYTEVKQLKF